MNHCKTDTLISFLFITYTRKPQRTLIREYKALSDVVIHQMKRRKWRRWSPWQWTDSSLLPASCSLQLDTFVIKLKCFSGFESPENSYNQLIRLSIDKELTLLIRFSLEHCQKPATFEQIIRNSMTIAHSRWISKKQKTGRSARIELR